VLGLGDPLCRNGFGMMEDFVLDLVVIQTVDELFRYFHERLPMESITFPRYLYFRRDCRGICQLPLRNQAELKNVISGRENQANTAAKATAREQFMYGYMRSLRK
jgi:hypothetical protein